MICTQCLKHTRLTSIEDENTFSESTETIYCSPNSLWDKAVLLQAFLTEGSEGVLCTHSDRPTPDPLLEKLMISLNL